ncbi:MAG: T9SS type A sorting domain-containing protein [Saprospiraceae bacterium]|nr:T9SS type A sorting domain-containing protein [Saprospiraceae bacterium]
MSRLKYLLLFVFTLMASLASAQEICNNRIDDDGDGLADCKDGDCAGHVSCWECETKFYQVHSNSTLVALNPSNGTYRTVASISGASGINGAQMNHLDGHVYAPCIIDGKHVLGMLQRNGSVVNLGLELPGNSIFYVGGVDKRGRLYIAKGSGSIYYVDLARPTLSVTSTRASAPGVADFAVDNTNGLLYGISGSGALKVFDPYKESVSTYGLAGSINNEKGGFGAAWSSNDGSFFAYNNSSGKIFSVDSRNLVATEVLNGVGNLNINDGFNCLWADPPFETNCGDGKDNDGDGKIDCEDGDCFNSNDCKVEICDNGIDDDGDGWIDCSDSECFALAGCVEICDNGIDDNGNGLVDGKDPQCSVSSGVIGGLESNGSLSDLVAERNYNNIMLENEVQAMKLEGLLPFEPSRSRSGLTMKGLIPEDFMNAFAAESSPSDLVGITNATDVAAADYYRGEQRIGTILAIQSDQVYEHTKYICDRLDGSRLIDVSQLYAQGGLFMTYELLTGGLGVEYAVSFSAYEEEGKGLVIHNHWNLDKYPADRQYYNFQLWCRDYQDLTHLLEAVLAKLSDVAPISSIEYSDLPRLFVTQGTYRNGRLQLQLRNKDGAESMTFRSSVRPTETAGYEQREFNVDLSGAQVEIIEVPIGHIYDLGASIVDTGNTGDELFLADGRWDVERDNPTSSVKRFNVTPQGTEASLDVFQIERSIDVEAEVKGYLNIYRSLNAKFKPVDVSAYQELKFAAEGSVKMEVTLVRESIAEWEDQPRVQIDLSSEGKLHVIDLLSVMEGDAPDDIIMLVFTMLGDNQKYERQNLSIRDVRFEKSSTTSIQQSRDVRALEIYPNPVRGELQVSFELSSTSTAVLRVYNAQGKTIRFMQGDYYAGRNFDTIPLDDLPDGVYYISMVGDNGEVFQETFVKTN